MHSRWRTFIRHGLSLLLMLSLMMQGQAIATARGTTHFHVDTAVSVLDTGHFDSNVQTHQHRGLLSDHQHAPDSAGVVNVAAPDSVGGVAKQLSGLDAPAPSPWQFPEAPTLAQQLLNTRLAFSSHLEAPPSPPPKTPLR